MVSMHPFGRKKVSLQPGETFNPRKHVDRRKENWAIDVPESGVSKDPTFVVSMAHYKKMEKPRPVRLTHGLFSAELPERRGQAANKKSFVGRLMERFRKK